MAKGKQEPVSASNPHAELARLRFEHPVVDEALRRKDEELSELYSRLAATTTLALRDQLTGLYNRRGFEEMVGRAHADLQRGALDGCCDRGLVIIMADLDHFKRANDTYGHAAGDQVLVNTADSMRRVFSRRSDVLGRRGGDEMIIAISGTAESLRIEKVQIMADKLCGSLRRNCGYGVTASVGVALWQPGDSLDDVIGNADRGAYVSKRAGRNCVTLYTPDMAEVEQTPIAREEVGTPQIDGQQVRLERG
ncbi:MAG: GGDEF domain-containing protein [Alphaproteobacteria bacterium]|nr:GGDEF domain-containing protein [Alphaproteobacteria bacterium]MBV8548340.1 GGDEF domain-containing protein [Alphaproteobacteria bacterium]